ncbi:acrosomal protein KIAA1210-like [Erinaceus europaeus]|uniref:Acrosomal protein KIAA1210-like n=1 Tax=Erinaceus europaeus TaxID=9365 RepID=A0ABM3WPZ0_ERIEU|nr:acrosomal protein KIAA1210-like [Erinaceus europaeus]
MALNLQKKKKKKMLDTMKAKKEGLHVQLLSEDEKDVSKAKAVEQNKSKKDSSDSLNADQTCKTDVCDKDKDETTNKRNRGKGFSSSCMSEDESKCESLKPSSSGMDFVDGDSLLPTIKTAKECAVLYPVAEHQDTERDPTPQAETPPPQGKLSDTEDTVKKADDDDLEVRNTPVSQLIPQEHEERVAPAHPESSIFFAGGDQSIPRAFLLSMEENLSLPQGDDIFSMVMESQLFLDPPPSPSSEMEEIPGLCVQSEQSISSENSLEDLHSCTSIEEELYACESRELAEGDLFDESLPQKSLSLFMEKLDSENESLAYNNIMAEVDNSDIKQQEQVVPGSAPQTPETPQDGPEFFCKTENNSLEASTAESTPHCVTQSLGKPEAEEGLVDSEKGIKSDQQLNSQVSFQALENPEDKEEGMNEFKSLLVDSNSKEQQTLVLTTQALEKSEVEASSELSSYTEKLQGGRNTTKMPPQLP